MKRKNRKRPCRICRKWFSPNPRVGERQKTCGAEECQKKWHAKKCAEWNKGHPVYFQEIYLSKKLEEVNEPDVQKEVYPVKFIVKSRKLPCKVIQEVIGTQPLVIIKYVNRLLFRSFQEVILGQLAEIKEEQRQLLGKEFSRGDSQQRGS